MSSSHGKFVWYELITTDTAAAEVFYKSVMRWSARDAGMPGMSYTLLAVGETGVGGLMALPESARSAGALPGWIGYVGVDDVDASTARLQEDGGHVYRAPDNIPGVGRFAMVADPQGAVLALFKEAAAMPGQPPAEGTPGHAGWRELHAADSQAAFGFYSKLFGWAKGESMDMGPMGVYQILVRDGEMLGAMMNKDEAEPAPFWLFYFNVESIDAAAARVRGAGGQVLNGPHEVPGGNWIVQCLDPQGALFALVGPRG